jgi:hypothetical protein
MKDDSKIDDEAPDPFDLASLRLDQTYSDGISVRKLITQIRVGRPQKQHFVRVNPDPAYRISPMAIIELKDDRESYLVSRAIAAELAGEFTSVALFTGITRAGTLFLWPVPLPGPDGKHNPWHRSALNAAELAESRWVRIVANMEAGGYDVSVAAANIPEPEWPEMPFNEMVRIAFQGRIVDRCDHPLVLKLRGAL